MDATSFSNRSDILSTKCRALWAKLHFETLSRIFGIDVTQARILHATAHRNFHMIGKVYYSYAIEGNF